MISIKNISLHEDFYLQIELVPSENYFKTNLNLNNDNSTIQLNNEFGFFEIKERIPHSIKLQSKHILNKYFIEKIFSKTSFVYYENIGLGYGDNYKTINSITGYGYKKLAFFVEKTELNTIKNICIYTYNWEKNKQYSDLSLILNRIGIEFDLVLVDWDEEIVIRLNNLKTVRNYLQEVFGLDEIL